MSEPAKEFCRKCDAEIDGDRAVDFTLKNGKSVRIVLYQGDAPAGTDPN